MSRTVGPRVTSGTARADLAGEGRDPMNGFKTAILLAALTGILVAIGHLAGGPQGAMIAFFFALALNFVSYWWSDRIVLRLHGAREVGPEELPRLHAIVERLAGRAGIP